MAEIKQARIDIGGSSYRTSYVPYVSDYCCARFQYIITASELMERGVMPGFKIKGISLYSYSNPNTAMDNFRIRLKEVGTKDKLTRWEKDDLTLLHHEARINTSSFRHNTWREYSFNQGTQEYIWSGENLLIDITKDGISTSSGGGNYVRDGLNAGRGAGGQAGYSGYSYPFDTLPFNAQTYILDTIIHYDPPYNTYGTWTSNSISLIDIEDYDSESSHIDWIGNTPEGTSLTIFTGLSDDSLTEPSTWTAIANGSGIDGASGNLSTKYLWIKAELSTTDSNITPELDSITVDIWTSQGTPGQSTLAISENILNGGSSNLPITEKVQVQSAAMLPLVENVPNTPGSSNILLNELVNGSGQSSILIYERIKNDVQTVNLPLNERIVLDGANILPLNERVLNGGQLTLPVNENTVNGGQSNLPLIENIQRGSLTLNGSDFLTTSYTHTELDTLKLQNIIDDSYETYIGTDISSLTTTELTSLKQTFTINGRTLFYLNRVRANVASPSDSFSCVVKLYSDAAKTNVLKSYSYKPTIIAGVYTYYLNFNKIIMPPAGQSWYLEIDKTGTSTTAYPYIDYKYPIVTSTGYYQVQLPYDDITGSFDLDIDSDYMSNTSVEISLDHGVEWQTYVDGIIPVNPLYRDYVAVKIKPKTANTFITINSIKMNYGNWTSMLSLNEKIQTTDVKTLPLNEKIFLGSWSSNIPLNESISMKDGDPEQPRKIYTAADFNDIRNHTNDYYVLMNDIDLSGIHWNSIGSFSGQIDGNGFVVRGLNAETEITSREDIKTGLTVNTLVKFASFVIGTNSGTIKNIIFEGMDIEASCAYSSLGVTDVSFIDYNTGTVKNVVLKGRFYNRCIYGNSVKVSGMCIDNAGTIEDCYIDVEVVLSDYTYSKTAGAIYIIQSGGLIKNCLIRNTSRRNSPSRPIFYTAVSSNQIVSCYYNKNELAAFYADLSQASSGRTSTELKTKATYVGWDFINTWDMKGSNYPYNRFVSTRTTNSLSVVENIKIAVTLPIIENISVCNIPIYETVITENTTVLPMTEKIYGVKQDTLNIKDRVVIDGNISLPINESIKINGYSSLPLSEKVIISSNNTLPITERTLTTSYSNVSLLEDVKIHDVSSLPLTERILTSNYSNIPLEERVAKVGSNSASLSERVVRYNVRTLPLYEGVMDANNNKLPVNERVVLTDTNTLQIIETIINGGHVNLVATERIKAYKSKVLDMVEDIKISGKKTVLLRETIYQADTDSIKLSEFIKSDTQSYFPIRETIFGVASGSITTIEYVTDESYDVLVRKSIFGRITGK